VDDPILPGSLLLDSMFQLTGVFAGLLGFHGRGRALKADRTRFLAEVLPTAKTIAYRIDVHRVHNRSQTVLADGTAHVDDQLCAEARGLLIRIHGR
jgi:3-hydroxyacyl-[acyl-carrier protein] dehydratase/trans-2-decenoyl-[acyl-carrier protein] isomerase